MGKKVNELIHNGILSYSSVQSQAQPSLERFHPATGGDRCRDSESNNRWSSGNQKRERKDCWSQRMEATVRTLLMESAEQGSYGLTATESTILKPACSCTRSSALCYISVVWCFCGTPKSRSENLSGSFAHSYDHFTSSR